MFMVPHINALWYFVLSENLFIVKVLAFKMIYFHSVNALLYYYFLSKFWI